MNDDDIDFTPNRTTSKNLKSLFGDNKPRPNDNPTLVYTPPKAPKSGESTSDRDSCTTKAHKSTDSSAKRELSNRDVSGQPKAQQSCRTGGVSNASKSKITTGPQRLPHTNENISNYGTIDKGVQKQTGLLPNIHKNESLKSLSNEKLNVICAQNVQLYKFEQTKYINLGTAGIALVGNFDLHVYQIILYKNKMDYISKMHLSPNFIFTIMENNYASFYDDGRQNWSVLFSSLADVQAFGKEVAVAKFNCQTKLEKMIIQDLAVVSSHKAQSKDVVEVKYSCYQLAVHDVIPFKEDVILVEIDGNNSHPWYDGLRECSVQCKRIVILPYCLSAPWKNGIESDSSVLLEVEIQSIIGPSNSCNVEETKNEINVYEIEQQTLVLESENEKQRRYEKKSNIDSDSSAYEDVREEEAEDKEGKSKAKSLTDSIFLSRSHKPDLISRIARMGQALPLRKMISSPSDSEDERPQANRSVRGTNNPAYRIHQNISKCSFPCPSPDNNKQNGSHTKQDCHNIHYSRQDSNCKCKEYETWHNKKEYLQNVRRGDEYSTAVPCVPCQGQNEHRRTLTGEDKYIDDDIPLRYHRNIWMEDEFQDCEVPRHCRKEHQQTAHTLDECDEVRRGRSEKRGYVVAVQQLHTSVTGQSNIDDKNNQASGLTRSDSDLRIIINKVDEKVDHILKRLETLESSNWEKVKDHESAADLDPMSVVRAIYGLNMENESLKSEIDSQKTKIGEQDKKIQDLLETTQRYIRKLTEDANPAVSEVASKICDLESRLKDSDKQICAASCQIDQLTKANENYKRDICEKEKQITDLNSILCELREKLLKHEDLQKNVEKELTQLKAKNETLMNLNEKQKIELNNFKRQELGESSKESLQIEYIEAEIKKVMNGMNKKLQSQFEPSKYYSGHGVKETIASTIKVVTIEYLKQKAFLRPASNTSSCLKEIGEAIIEPQKEKAERPHTTRGCDDECKKLEASDLPECVNKGGLCVLKESVNEEKPATVCSQVQSSTYLTKTRKDSDDEESTRVRDKSSSALEPNSKQRSRPTSVDDGKDKSSSDFVSNSKADTLSKLSSNLNSAESQHRQDLSKNDVQIARESKGADESLQTIEPVKIQNLSERQIEMSKSEENCSVPQIKDVEHHNVPSVSYETASYVTAGSSVLSVENERRKLDDNDTNSFETETGKSSHENENSSKVKGSSFASGNSNSGVAHCEKRGQDYAVDDIEDSDHNNIRYKRDIARDSDSNNERAEKNCVEEKTSSESSENVKTIDSKASYKDSVLTEYFQNWGSTKPPPLPSDSDSGNDEEWL